MDNSDLRYPIGKFEFPKSVTREERTRFVEEIAAAPAQVKAVVAGLDTAQLDTPYRPGGWTVRQLAHHIPDSHMNSYVRFRLALTEDEPTINPYEEGRWAELADARTSPVEMSQVLLDSLHKRWLVLLRSLSDTDWKRTFRHPELGVFTLEQAAALYAWHGRHHVAHIKGLRDRMGWQ